MGDYRDVLQMLGTILNALFLTFVAISGLGGALLWVQGF